MWKIRFYEEYNLDPDEVLEYESITSCMELIEIAYADSGLSCKWNDQLKYMFEDNVLADIIQLEDPEQLDLFEPDSEEPSHSRFGEFSDSELWLLLRLLETSVAQANSYSKKIRSEILWEQRIRKENKVEE